MSESTELTGAAAAESDAGFKPMTPASREVAEFKTPRDAARATKAPASAAPESIMYLKDGGRAPANQTVKLTEAADDLTAYRSDQRDSRALSISADFAEQIDRMRHQGVQAADEVPRALPDPAAASTPVAPAASDEAAIDGFMKIPAVRSAVEDLMASVDQEKANYAQARAGAQSFGRAALYVVAPELEAIPLEQFQKALETLRVVEPARYQQVSKLLDLVGRLAATENYEKTLAAQQNAQWAAQENIKFERAVPLTPDGKKAVAAEMVDYAAAELGIGYQELIHHMRVQPVLMDARFQKLIADAMLSRITQRNAANWKSKKAAPVPTVARPGVSTSRSERSHADLTALDSKLARTGDIKDAFELLKASRRGGK